MPEQKKLIISPREYEEIITESANRHVWTPEGLADAGFMMWMMRRFDLQPFTAYAIEVDWQLS